MGFTAAATVIGEMATEEVASGLIVDAISGTVMDAASGTVMDGLAAAADGTIMDVATGAAVDAATGTIAGTGASVYEGATAAGIADQVTLPGNVMNIASSQPGVWDQFVNSISTPAGAASALKTGAGLGGLFSGISSIRNPGISPQSAQTMADPFAPSRQQYINQLNSVMANPSLAMSQPGYQFQFQEGLQGLNRNLAARGMGTGTPGQPGTPASGGAGMAQQRYGQQFAQTSYNDYVKQLSGLAGAGQNPSVGATEALNAQKQAQQTAQAGWGAFGQGAGILSDLLRPTGAPPQQSPAPVSTGIPIPPTWNQPTSIPDIPIAPTGWSSGYDVPSQDTSSWTSGFDLFS